MINSDLLRNLKKSVALRGKGKRRMMHIVSDLLNAQGITNQDLSIETGLSVSTINRLMTMEEPYSPQALTIEKVLIATNAYVEIKLDERTKKGNEKEGRPT